MSTPPPSSAAFDRLWVGDWLVDGPGNRLSRDGEVRPLRHKAMAVLLVLAREAGRTVSREALVAEVWDGNEYVANQAINNAIWSIRQALGDSSEAPRYLETIPKKGYRLIAEVCRETASAQAQPPATRRRPWPLLAAGLAACLAAGFGLRQAGEPPPLAYGPPEALSDYPGLEYLGRLSPDGQWLAFGWWQGSRQGRLFLRPRADRKAAPRDISGEHGEVTGMAWAPDGRTLAYAAIHEPNRCTLWRYELIGERHTALGDCQPLWTPTLAWSPDGKRLAFSGRDAAGAGGLFLMDAAGGPARRLTPARSLGEAERQPAWSPDGQRIAYAAGNAEDASLDLYETDLAGRVTRLSHERLRGLHGVSHAPNGQDLIYSTTRQGSRQLMLWERASGRSRPLGLEGSAPDVAADGSLVYALLRQHRSLGVLELPAPGGQAVAPRRMARSLFPDYAPVWSPAAGLLAFVSQRSGHEELWLSAGDGAGLRQLTHLQGVADAPAFAPAGRSLAFLGSCGEAGRYGLCRVAVEDGAVQPLLADGKTYGAPAWEADGRHVWLSSDRNGAWRLWRVAADGSGAEARPTAHEPGFVQVAADGASLYYSPRFSEQIQRLDLASGRESTVYGAPADRRLASWRLGPEGLALLTRGTEECLERLVPGVAIPEALACYPLGSFSEFARFSLAGARVYIDLADVNLADLMHSQSRGDDK
ncbi:MAG: PD40 domain-containing protein [Gammaproteobacteria bacterium]|nr:PD40 domain-containing protein [Gammaproteobacteria bacterium]